MSKLSPLVEGILSVFVLLPSVSNAKPNYIEASPVQHNPVGELSIEQPFMQVGAMMNDVAHKQLGQNHE